MSLWKNIYSISPFSIQEWSLQNDWTQGHFLGKTLPGTEWWFMPGTCPPIFCWKFLGGYYIISIYIYITYHPGHGQAQLTPFFRLLFSMKIPLGLLGAELGNVSAGRWGNVPPSPTGAAECFWSRNFWVPKFHRKFWEKTNHLKDIQ